MSDFYADHPFPELVLGVADAPTMCAVGDAVAGMKSGQGRVERFVDGGVVIHLTKMEHFMPGDTLASPTGSAVIDTVGISEILVSYEMAPEK